MQISHVKCQWDQNSLRKVSQFHSVENLSELKYQMFCLYFWILALYLTKTVAYFNFCF